MGQPAHYECKNCNASWSEYKAKKCPYCLSKNIFIFWEPGKKFKSKRIKLKVKPERIKLKSKD